MTQSIIEELIDIDLGDKRRNERSRDILADLFADPQASINASADGWNDTTAAYRFFKNPNIDAKQILAAHAAATKRRFAPHNTILIIQDTTELDFTKHPAEDSRVLNAENRFGLYDHSHVAFTPEHLCLGVLDVHLFDRDPATLGESQKKKKLDIAQKESNRWLDGYKLACEVAAEYPEKQIISVSDRESDLYEIFLHEHSTENAADFVIRAKHPRRTYEKDIHAGPYTFIKVRDEVLSQEVRMKRRVDLPQTPKRAARTAELEIRTKRVTVQPPYNAPASTPSVQYNVVLVTEVDGPGDGTDVEWELITTLPIDTVNDVLFVLDTYVARWPIEIYFRTLKSGCRIEDLQLKDNSRRIRALMLYKIVAWRVMHLTFLGRECPELSCEVMFSEAEWKPVWKIVREDALPETPPTLGLFMLLLGRLGGHNNRNSDTAPGPQAIWTGIRRMTDFALAWAAFGPDADAKVPTCV